MRKRSLFVTLFILLALVIVALNFYPHTFRRQIDSPMGINKTLEHIIDAKKLAKWYIPFANGDSSKEVISAAPHQKISLGQEFLEITGSNSINTSMYAANGKTGKELVFQMAPDEKDMTKSSVTLIYKTTLLKYLLGMDELGENAQKSLDNFATYLQSTKLLYGYDIQKALVTDTAFLFGSDTVLTSDKLKGAAALYERLINFSKEKNAGYNGVRIFHSQNLPDHKIALLAGIGVSQKVNSVANDPFQYKTMPGGKNLLVTDYEGPYSEVPSIYKSQKQYVEEHKLTTMAMPFEKFISEGFGFADSQVAKIKVCYPIY